MTDGLITRSTLRAAKWRFTAHLNMGRAHVTTRECVDFPGLRVSDSYDRKARHTTRTFFVDGDKREFAQEEDAARVWNDQRRAATADAPIEAAA